MRVIENKIEGETIIAEDTELRGMIVGSTVVENGITLQLHGMIVGNLILEKSSLVYLYGAISGDITNKGGYLEIHGFVNGKVIREGGETIIDPKAVIL